MRGRHAPVDQKVTRGVLSTFDLLCSPLHAQVGSCPSPRAEKTRGETVFSVQLLPPFSALPSKRNDSASFSDDYRVFPSTIHTFYSCSGGQQTPNASDSWRIADTVLRCRKCGWGSIELELTSASTILLP